VAYFAYDDQDGFEMLIGARGLREPDDSFPEQKDQVEHDQRTPIHHRAARVDRSCPQASDQGKQNAVRMDRRSDACQVAGEGS
jgi:hypothetical protein